MWLTNFPVDGVEQDAVVDSAVEAVVAEAEVITHTMVEAEAAVVVEVVMVDVVVVTIAIIKGQGHGHIEILGGLSEIQVKLLNAILSFHFPIIFGLIFHRRIGTD